MMQSKQSCQLSVVCVQVLCLQKLVLKNWFWLCFCVALCFCCLQQHPNFDSSDNHLAIVVITLDEPAYSGYDEAHNTYCCHQDREKRSSQNCQHSWRTGTGLDSKFHSSASSKGVYPILYQTEKVGHAVGIVKCGSGGR